MPSHQNRAHTEAPAMSFEQQVAQVLDSLTKELTMSEPPTGPLDAANEYAAHTQHDTELLTAYEEANRLRAWMDGPELGDEDVPDWAIAKYSRLISVIAEKPAFTAGGVVAKLQTFTREVEGCVYSHVGEGRAEGLLPQFIRTALEGAQRLTGSAADWAPETTRILELDITFAEAADRYCALRRAEMEANRRGDQGAADDANRQHCRLADQIMDATPSTPADAMVMLSMLADREMGIAAGIDDERAQRALEQVYALLSTAGQPLSQSKASELSAMVCRWLELRDIASPSKRQSAELERLAGRIAAYQPHSTADAMAHLGFVLAYYMGDSTFDLESDDSSYARALQKGLAYFANAGDPAAGTLYRLGSIGLTSARAFWVNPEAGGEVARLEHREAEAFRGEADDDAELLDLWRRYLPLKAEAERIDEAGDLEGWMRAHEPCNALEKRMATVPARTPTGIAVKLAVLWQWGGAVVERRGRNNERENGPDRLSDHMVQWLWMIMNEARALGAPMPLLPNDTTTDMTAAAEDSRRLVLEIESEAPVDPVADAEAEGAEEEDLPVVDRTGSGLSKAELRFTNVLDRMGPDDKEGLILTGEAMIALGDAMKAAQKAAAIDRRWSEFFAKLLREDAAKLHPEGDSGLVAANGDSATADPFSDAVKDIGAQAPATLSMPLEMTDRMVDAGASAAGITPEQFKAAVIAARDARAA